jgi:hypothetical protein
VVRVHTRIDNYFAHYPWNNVSAIVPWKRDIGAGIVQRDHVAAFLMVKPPAKS